MSELSEAREYGDRWRVIANEKNEENAALRAELRAEIRRLTDERDEWIESNQIWQEVAAECVGAAGVTALVHVPARIRELGAENAALRAEVERYKTLLRTWFEDDGGPRYIERTHGEWLNGLAAAVRNALSGSTGEPRNLSCPYCGAVGVMDCPDPWHRTTEEGTSE